MKTKPEIIADFKKEYPTLRSGDDERGYTDFNPADYEATIEAWADNQIALEVEAVAKAETEAQAATAKAALLAKLGITEEEARLLLGGN
jgi:hypothetical protein